jgi:hypothetical protein
VLEAMFERDGSQVVPGPICTGPWDPNVMHGGPPLALCGRLLADHAGGADDFHLARVTVELVRPIPLSPLTVEVTETRMARRIQLLDAVVRAGDGLELAYARGMRILRAENGLDEGTIDMPGPLDLPGPQDATLVRHDYRLPPGGFYLDAFEIRSCDGRTFGPLGPSAAWFKLLVPVFAGENISPLDRVLSVGDFGNGISNITPRSSHVYINPDVAVHLHRLPIDEWVLSDALTHARAAGFGTASAVLADRDGHLGVANQSLMVQQRP